MTDTKLTNDQAVALLRKLGTDDAFRSLFEAKPAMALHQAGIPPETIVGLNAKCLCPKQLADKSVYQDVASKLDRAVVAEAMAMNTPHLNLRS
ncbi:MAG TPA: NHLP-related RiPP peptide [Dokdonella sp.]|jgi:putative modified peptide|nr:NHLP-related RiPP peptide [Dokdonella sp.]